LKAGPFGRPGDAGEVKRLVHGDHRAEISAGLRDGIADQPVNPVR